MSKIHLKYDLDEKPPFKELLPFGLQWLVITIPMIIIIGKLVAGLHYDDPGAQTIYMQKIFFVMGISLLAQILWGHRLPLIMGPASVLLVGIIASLASSINTIYTSIFLCGLILAVLSITGLFKPIIKLFTPNVVIVILLLIPFTLVPTILNLIFPSGASVNPFHNLLFALVLIFTLFWTNKVLTGIWKTTLIVWAMIIGHFLYSILFSVPLYQQVNTNLFAGFWSNFTTSFSLDTGVLISFFICYLALATNELGSIQSVGEVLKPDEMTKRTDRGITITGLSNVLAGFLGVIGPVSFSLSLGVITSTGVASRFTLIPTALGLMTLGFMPSAITILGSISSVVIGAILVYILTSQVAAGFMLVAKNQNFKLEQGLLIGFPLLLSVLISFIPTTALNLFPDLLKPLLGNGFVVGFLGVLIMEHIIYKERA
ncbi:Xanthine/uracil permease [Desulfonispora thiosulfatigenes DSM 11270]|uniref:Xanthine/uracil permease n=1 Tax=Desulfonispora thiosulfatigenes DSM 11270 TaxID=656914 RepID=A0A1W1UYG6_DESTI|nr:solute carrier family 23 protein [Desulfonispora thiosulfatigenes]SMB85791.1 Xanthine/uracil permease [Desulfonispora thiosulfatigenes DSM 11270]